MKFSVSDTEEMVESSEISDEINGDESSVIGFGHHMNTGYLELYPGPMFSNKTTRLLTTLSKLSDLGWRAVYVNHECDSRTTKAQDNIVTTHNSQFRQLSNSVDGLKLSNLKELNPKKYDVIGIDEGQFFEDLYPSVLKFINKYKKYVIVSFLDGDSNKNPFGDGLKLIPHADKYEKLTAYCSKCIEERKMMVPAPFTARLNNNLKEQIQVGGAKEYMAMCRYHHDLNIQSFQN